MDHIATSFRLPSHRTARRVADSVRFERPGAGRNQLRVVARGLAYGTGLLGLSHRLRHRDTLTVAMFHRVTAPGTAGADRADPVHSMPAPLFAACLAFFRRHYAVIGLDQLRASIEGGERLPPRALLVTFDDGWQDNADVALPLLRQAGLPAAVFVTAAALDPKEYSTGSGWWWQEILLRALRERRAPYAALWRQAGPEPTPADAEELALLLHWGNLPPAERRRRLAPYAVDAADEGRHMIGAEGFGTLTAAGIGIGAHGATHLPLTRLADPAAELARSRAALAAFGPAPDTLSFPHGRYDETVLAAARAEGFRIAFTSDACLNATRDGRPASRLLGRVAIEAAQVADTAGRLVPSRLATWLFHHPVQRLDDALLAGAA